MNSITIKCPHCQKDVSIDQALTHQFEETQKQELEAEKQKLHKLMEDWKKSQEEKLSKIAEEEALKKAEGLNKELQLLKEEAEKKDKLLTEAREMELKLRQEKNALDDEKKAFELEKQRQLDEERELIKKKTAEELLEMHRMKDAEKDKQMADMKKTIEELQQKANLTSQQLQGEVLELELENELKNTFPLDEISPVGKGINGADIVQKVRDSKGQICGVIVWESKRTKSWDKGWPVKLKEDMLRVKGDVAVLVTTALPDGVKDFNYKDGIYVTTFDCFLSLASVIRKTLLDNQMVKSSMVGKNEKMEMIYNYFLSNEFRQRVESILETFGAMKTQLDSEKRVFAKVWAEREKQIDKILNNTATMQGDIQGLMGPDLSPTPELEFNSLLSDSESTDTVDTKTLIAETVLEQKDLFDEPVAES